MKRNLPLFLAFVVCILITLFSSGIPLFWDAVYYALPATQEGKSGFNPLHVQEAYDTGGFPFYALLLKLAWRIFKFHLIITHIALLPFLWAIVFAFYRIGKLFLTEKILPWALLLLFLEPCFLTQAVLAAPDIILLSFFLLALMAMLEKRRMLFTLFLVFLFFCNVRGTFAIASLFILDYLFSNPLTRKKVNALLPYIPVTLLAFSWFLYHHRVSGWYVLSPLREQTDEHSVSIRIMLKHIVLVVWKLIDSGRIILWIFLGFGFLYFRKNKDPLFSRMLLMILLPLLCFSALLIPISNPIGARYFMPVFVLLIFPVCYLLQQWKTIQRIGSVILMAAILLSGNYWIYPERLSNEWDTSLKVMPYFKLEQDMREFIYTTSLKNKEMNPYKIGTQFPLINSRAETYLSHEWNVPDIISYFDNELHYTNALDGPVSKFHYYLHSNVCNTDLLPQIEEVKKKWKLVKEFRQGLVYISLYENPNY
ncbi:MAG: hypothetical protein ACHQRM_06485 [Bacteroidia bacterium]